MTMLRRTSGQRVAKKRAGLNFDLFSLGFVSTNPKPRSVWGFRLSTPEKEVVSTNPKPRSVWGFRLSTPEKEVVSTNPKPRCVAFKKIQTGAGGRFKARPSHLVR